jgi:hypothetical protein
VDNHDSPHSGTDLSVDSLDVDCKPPIHASSPTKYIPKITNGKPLRIINVNCQSINGKKGAWVNLLQSTEPDIIIATETWLNTSVSSSELECDGFTIYRKDRLAGAGGGVLIAINSSLTSSEVSITTSSEILWTKIHCRGHRDILVAACYRPDVSDKTTTTELRASLEVLSRRRSRPCSYVIGGDFNYPGWDWSTSTLKPGTHFVSLHHEFMDMINDYGLVQHITEPTRLSNTLDLLATNMPEQVRRIRVIPGISDHAISYIELSVQPIAKRQVQRKVWLFNKADWTGMAEFLRPRLKRLDLAYNPSPNAMWNNIRDLLTEAATIFIPRKKTKRKVSCP